MLVMCTYGINASYGAEREYNAAIEMRKLVVALKFAQASLPPALLGLIRCQFNEDNFHEQFEVLAKRLPESFQEHVSHINRLDEERARIQRVPTHEPRVVPASKRALSLLLQISSAYNLHSVLPASCSIEDFQPTLHRDMSFLQLYVRAPLESEWIEEENRSIIVGDLGESIVLGERNYLRDLWLGYALTQHFSIRDFNLEAFSGLLESFAQTMPQPVLFAPIEHFVQMASWSIAGAIGVDIVNGMIWKDRASYFATNGLPIRVIWSNNVAPLRQFILADQSATRWIVKPDPQTGERLSVTLVENQREPKRKVDLLARTFFRAELKDQTKIIPFDFQKSD